MKTVCAGVVQVAVGDDLNRSDVVLNPSRDWLVSEEVLVLTVKVRSLEVALLDLKL